MNKDLTIVPCLWEILKEESRPIFLYGTGNGADKILDVCMEYGIEIKGVFASSGFVRNRVFRDMQVKSIDMIREEYGDDIIVLLAFGTTLDSVIDNIRDIATRHTLYIPEVPLYESKLFDRNYYIENLSDIEAAEKLFSDKQSIDLYNDMIQFRLSGKPEYLSNVTTPVDMYSSLLDEKKIHKVIDCGAFKGDSATDIIEAIHPKELIALEPDPKTFLKLSAYADTVEGCKVKALNYAVGASEYTIEFNTSGSRGSGIEGANKRGKTTEVSVVSLDSLAIDGVDLIKYDVEGNEYDAIIGSENTICSSSPALSISVYHRSEDLFKLPLLIKSICPDYDLYLRRVPCIPAWDISLVAIPKDKKREP